MITAEVVTDPSDLEVVWPKQYEKLAHVFADVIGKGQRVAEIGCGRGQLTIPLARRAKNLFPPAGVLDVPIE